MIDVEELTVSGVHDALRKGKYTCRDLTSAYLDRINALDKAGPRINATWALSETALDEATELDRYFKETGQFKGRLHGVTVLVKDQADTKGMVTTYGSAAALKNIPEEDAFIVKKLKAEGAVILGKTSMPDWASSWFSASSVTNWEFTHNPYKLGFDVGASSGGSAAAVAANFALLAIAEDTGGSIRCPSSFNNIVGIRCTPGLISRSGFCPLLKPQDTPGPMARNVDDCARMLDCLVGFDPNDEWTAVAVTAGTPQGGSYATDLDPTAITRTRIGVIRSLFGPDSDAASAAVNRVIHNAMTTLAAKGTTFVDIEIPDRAHMTSYTSMYAQRSRGDINAFLATKPHLPKDVADIVPVEPPHPTLDFTSAISHGPLSPGDDETYLPRLISRESFQRQVVCIMAQHNVEALMFPDVQVPPPRHEDATNGRFPTCWDFPINTLLASSTRLPAISVPAGFTEDGLPVGMELMSWEYREKYLLQLAKGVETLIGARKSPKL